MPRYVIERDIPDIGTAEREALREAAHKSNTVLAEIKAERKNIQWEHTYIGLNIEKVPDGATYVSRCL